ncbi:MAG TPA: hypothetical protein VLY24_28385 [Bryobacteraceae bacterium]|nr:hypothetical protein [Bryobacteraceae bacterium]
MGFGRIDIPAVVTGPSPQPQAEEVRNQLERLLSSQQFRSSRRCQHLLRHITEHTLAGDGASLKERTLGVEVFGRPADYDTGQDPVVRATAAEIRKKLAQYYQEPGHEQEPRIELVSGGYTPEFHSANGFHDTGPLPHKVDRRIPIAGVAVGVVVLVAGGLLAAEWRPSSLDRFWAPVVQTQAPVLISLGQPIVYNLASTQAQDRLQGEAGDPAATSLPPFADRISRSDLVVLRDRYLALGDAICLARIAGLLEKHGKPYRIRGEGSTSSSDLREAPAVLIGAFDNQWTLRASPQLRFTFVKDSAHATDMVRDRLHPERTDWKLIGAWPYWNIANDYAIVSRLVDANTDHPVIIAAGITHYGTMAAGELLSNPAYFAEAAGQLPRGWQKKNLQIVLRVPVVAGAVGHPRVLATHVW